jgi:6,7-dimethyl-8-ribityllumazine synthase
LAGRAPAARRTSAGATARYAVVAARFNERISRRLVEGALHAFAAAKVPEDHVEVHWVPGSFELAQAANHLAVTGRYGGIVCVGVVIRGQTPHFEHVSREAASGIRHVALTTGVPTGYGVLTTLDEEQAWARAGGDVGNRGEEAAAAVIEMADFVQALRGNSRAAVFARPSGRSANRMVPRREASPSMIEMGSAKPPRRRNR